MGKVNDNKLSAKDFAAQIKAKYPEYQDVDDIKLANAMIKKYPVYKNSVYFEGVVEKKSPNVPMASSGVGVSMAGKNKLPVGVASQKMLESYGVTPVGGKTTVKDIYKGVVAEAKAQSAPKVKAPVVNQKPVEEDGKYWERTKSTLSTLGKSIIDGVVATSSEQVAIMAKTLDDELRDFIGAKPLNKRIEDYQTYKWAQDIKGATEKAFQPNAEFKGEIQEQVAQTAGDLLGLVATALITKNPSSAIAKLGTKGIVRGLANSATRRAITREIAKDSIKMLAKPTTFVAAAQTGTRNYDEAKAKGATDDEANAMFWSTAITGGLANSLPVGSLLNRFDMASGGKMKSVVVGGVVGGIEEAITEGIEQISTNFAAKNIYDETRNLFEGLGESTSMGGGIGFVLNAMGVKLGSIRNKFKDNPQKLAEIDNSIQYIKDIAEKEGQGSAMKLSNEERVRVDRYNSIINNPESSPEEVDVANEKIQEIAGQKIVDAENITQIVSSLPEDAQIEIKIIDAEIDRLSEAAAKSSNVEIKDGLVNKMSELIGQKNEIILGKQQGQVVEELNDSTLMEEQGVESVDSPKISESKNGGVYFLNGEKGFIRDDGQTVVFETKDKIIELGNRDEIAESKLSDYGVEKEQVFDISVTGNNSVIIDGVTYNNRYSDPLSAINTDSEGNVVSVNLDTENGQKRAFRGQRAEEIAYRYKLKQFEENATPESISRLEQEIARIEKQNAKPDPETKKRSVKASSNKDIELKNVKPTSIESTPGVPVEPPSPPTIDDTTPIEEPGNPQDARQKSMQMMKDQEDALREGAKKTGFWNKWIKRGFERQINVIRTMGDSPEAKKAKTMMTVVAGARSAADSKFKESESNIYKGLNLGKEKILDEILFHRRVSQIDSNYDNKGEKRIEHPRGFNKEESELALRGIKEEIGEKEYDNLLKRSDDYFKSQNDILKSLYDGGLINDATFNNLKDDDYIKRVFLDHINQNADGDAKALGDFGLSKDQVKSLKDGSTGLLLMDSRVLLNAAYRSAEQRIFQNKANKALSDVVKINPNLGFEIKPEIKELKDGSTRREIPPARNGYTKIRYFEKGVENAIEVKDNIAKEWLDLEKRTTELDSAVRTVMGTALLKNLATGTNATFAIGNVPADYLNVILFTDTFDNTNVFNAMQKLGRSFTSNMIQLSALNSTGKATDSFRALESDFTKYGGKMEFLTTYGRPDDLIKRDRRYGNIRNTIGKVGKKAVDVLAFTGEQSELAMRLSVFDETRKQLTKKAGGKEGLSNKEWDDINYEAAAKARKTMDFAKGGLWAKKLDNVSPYLNAAAQGTRVAAEYIYKNPKKFSEKMAQIGMATAALVLYNMMVGDEEDLKNIPDYVKKNYFIVFDPDKHKNNKGQDVRGYHLIKKTPAAQPFLNLFESGTMAAYNLLTGRKFGQEEDFIKSEWTAVNNALPIPLDIRELPNKMPPIPKAVLSYFANYDFYRNQNIVSKKEEDLLPKYQGVTDENVPTFFKGIGQYTGLSPKKLQASTEMIITNPRTNTMIGGAYAILDKMTEKYVEMPESWKNKSKEISTIFGGAKARVYREVDYNYSSYNSEKLKEFEKELKSKKFLMKNEVADLVEKQASKSDVVDFIKSQDISEKEKESLLKYAINIQGDKVLKQKLPNYYKLSPIKYFEGSPEDKAKLLSVNIGIIDPRSEEFKDLAIEMKYMKNTFK